MKRATLYLMLLASGATASGAESEATKYQLDPVHTQVFFSLSHLGFSHPNGRFRIKEGWFRFDPEHWEQSACSVTIAVESLNFGDAAWEKKVLSDEFFDLKSYPEASFECSALEKSGDDTGKLKGKLTLHGATREVVLDVRFNKVGTHSFTFQKLAGFSATGSLKRSDFGMKTLLPGVGDEVALRLEVEGHRVSG
jgi:polyisoprenoid-binding protein YceI